METSAPPTSSASQPSVRVATLGATSVGATLACVHSPASLRRRRLDDNRACAFEYGVRSTDHRRERGTVPVPSQFIKPLTYRARLPTPASNASPFRRRAVPATAHDQRLRLRATSVTAHGAPVSSTACTTARRRSSIMNDSIGVRSLRPRTRRRAPAGCPRPGWSTAAGTGATDTTSSCSSEAWTSGSRAIFALTAGPRHWLAARRDISHSASASTATVVVEVGDRTENHRSPRTTTYTSVSQRTSTIATAWQQIKAHEVRVSVPTRPRAQHLPERVHAVQVHDHVLDGPPRASASATAGAVRSRASPPSAALQRARTADRRRRRWR